MLRDGEEQHAEGEPGVLLGEDDLTGARRASVSARTSPQFPVGTIRELPRHSTLLFKLSGAIPSPHFSPTCVARR